MGTFRAARRASISFSEGMVSGEIIKVIGFLKERYITVLHFINAIKVIAA